MEKEMSSREASGAKGKDTSLSTSLCELVTGNSNSLDCLAAIIDSLQDELTVITRDYRITYANRAMLLRLGKEAPAVIGRYCYDISYGLDAPCSSALCQCPVRKVLESGEPAAVVHEHTTGTSTTKRRYLSVVCSPIKDSEGNITAIIELMRDVTGVKEMEQRMAEAHRNLLTLSTIASVVSQSLDLNTVLESALVKILEIMKTDVGGILLLDEEKQMLCYRAHHGFSSDYVQKVCYPLNGDIDGKVFQTGEAILAEDAPSDPRTYQSLLVAAEGLKAFASVPLRAKGKVLGVINIASRRSRAFSPEDIHLLYSITPQIAMAVENAKLHQEVQYKDQIRGELLQEILSIQEEERRRIARELHDETSQSLASLAASLEAVVRVSSENPEKARAEIRKAQSLSLSILGEIHKIIYELRPTLLDDLGLVAATRWLADNILGVAGTHVDFAVSGRNRRLISKSEASLFRVIQEAISNIGRHARAKNAVIRICFKKDIVTVRISDDGTGFDVEEAISSKERPRGLGLLGMKERIEFMGGNLDIQSQPDGKGTIIDIEIPLICQVPERNHVSHV